MQPRYVRILKAEGDTLPDPTDEDEGEKKGLSPEEKQARYKRGQNALYGRMSQLAENPPRDETGAIDADLFLEDVIFSINHKIADMMGLDEDERWEVTEDEDGNIVADSVMTVPLINRPILDYLNLFKETIPGLARAQEMQEAKAGITLEKLSKEDFLPDDIADWSQRGIVNYFQNKGGKRHPFAQILAGVEMPQDTPGMRRVRVKRDRGPAQFERDFEQRLDEEAKRQRQALADTPFSVKDTDKRFKDEAKRAARQYEELFARPEFNIDMGRGDGAQVEMPRSDKNVEQWKRLIQNKIDEGAKANVAARMVQEDVNNHMRVLLSDENVGATGRSSAYQTPEERERKRSTPNIITPSFAEAIKQMGGRVERANTPDEVMETYLRGDDPTDSRARANIYEMLTSMPNQGLHPSLSRALRGDGALALAAQQAGLRDADEEDNFDRDLAAQGDDAAAVEERGREGGTLGTEMSGFTNPKAEAAALREAGKTRAISQRNVDQKMRDIDMQEKFGMMSSEEANTHRALLRTDDQYDPTPFAEEASGFDFSVDHPWHGLSEEDIKQKVASLIDDLVGESRKHRQFLRAILDVPGEDGLTQSELNKLNLSREDTSNISRVLALPENQREEALAKFDKKDARRYKKVIDSGLTRAMVMNIDTDLDKMRSELEGLDIDPLSFINAATQLAGGDFSEQGFARAMMSMMQMTRGSRAKDGGYRVRADFMRVMAALKRQAERRAAVEERHESMRRQREQIMAHIDRKNEEGEEAPEGKVEQCEACHPRHFGTTTKEEALRNAPHGSPRGTRSAFVHKPAPVPIITKRYDLAQRRTVDLPLVPDESGDLSVGDIAYYLFGGQKTRETYMEELEKRKKWWGGEQRVKNWLQKQVDKAVKHQHPDMVDRLQNVRKKFDLSMENRNVLGTGYGTGTAKQRATHGHLFPSTWLNNDGARRKRAISDLTARQMMGVHEGYDILRAIRSGDIDVNVDLSQALATREGRAELIKNIYSNSSAASRRNALTQQMNDFSLYLSPVLEEYRKAREDIEKRYGGETGMVKVGPGTWEKGSLHPDINPKANERYKRALDNIEKQFRTHIHGAMHNLDRGIAPLEKAIEAGQDFITLNTATLKMLGYRPGAAINFGVNDGEAMNFDDDVYTIKEIQKPRGRGVQRTVRIQLDRPITRDIFESGVLRSAEEDFRPAARKLATNAFVKAAFDNDDSHPSFFGAKEFVDALTAKRRDNEKQLQALSANVGLNERVSEYGLGAILMAGDQMAPLVYQTKENEIIKGLKGIRDSLYINDDGTPREHVVMANVKTGEVRHDQFPVDEYMTGKMDQTLGSGITYEHNNRLPFPFSDEVMAHAAHQSFQGRMLTKKQSEALLMDSIAPEYSEQELAVLREFDPDFMSEYEPSSEEELSQEELNAGVLPEHKRAMQQRAQHINIDAVNHAMNTGEHDPTKPFNITPTACGTCGGNAWVPLETAVHFIQAHNPDMATVDANSQTMHDYIADHLRPRLRGSFDAQDGDLKPHESYYVTCPECDQNDPSSETGRCADGVCSHCHGAGTIDFDNCEHIVNGDGEIEGFRHNPHIGGDHFEDDDHFNDHLIQTQKDAQRREGKRPINGPSGFAWENFNDMVAQGRALPPTPLDAVKKLNRKRYAQAEEEKITRRKAQERRERGGMAPPMQPREFEDIGDEELEETRAGIDNIPAPAEKNNALLRAYHGHHLPARLERLLHVALVTGSMTEEEANEMRERAAAIPDVHNAHNNTNHPYQELLNEVQRIAEKAATGRGYKKTDKATREIVRDGVRYEPGDKMTYYTGHPRYTADELPTGGHLFDDELKKFRSARYEPLVYKHGRFITRHEDQYNIFHPDERQRESEGGKPLTPRQLITDRDIENLFRYNKQALKAFKNGNENFSDEQYQKALDALKEAEKKGPLMENKRITGVKSPMLTELMNEMGMSADEIETFFKEAVPTSTGEQMFPTWTTHATSTIPKSQLNQLFLHPTKVDEQGRAVNLDADFENGRKSIQRQQGMEYAKRLLVKTLIERMHGLAHPDIFDDYVEALLEFNRLKGYSDEIDENGDPVQPLDMSDYQEFAQMSGMDAKLRDAAIAYLTDMEDESEFDKKFSMVNNLKIHPTEDDEKEVVLFNPRHFKADMMPSEDGSNRAYDGLHDQPVVDASNAGMPKTLNQLLNASAQKALEGHAQDAQVADNMREMAMARYFPNYLHEKAVTDAVIQGGFDNVDDMVKAHGGLPPGVSIAQAMIKRFHPTWQSMPYEDLNTFDAIGVEDIRRERAYQDAMNYRQYFRFRSPLAQAFGSDFVRPSTPAPPLEPTPATFEGANVQPFANVPQQNPQDST